MSVSAQDVEFALQSAFPGDPVQVQDDSHLHAGHAGAREGRHYSVRVVSTQFVGVPRVRRHRLVYDALASLIPRGIHALAIEASAPGETQA
jgi:BolA family transcriptional regulator, general stress-responsive regulator